MKSAPLATTFGACIEPLSYFSAMAKCVGLVTITSAVGHRLAGALHRELPCDAVAALLDQRVAVHVFHFLLDLFSWSS